MPTTTFTLIDNGSPHAFEATMGPGDTVRVAAAALAAALGWELKPQGFCKGDLCYPVPPRSDIANGDGIDLGAFASHIGRPLALDRDEKASYLGESAAARAGQLTSLQAPDFTLPDLTGRMHSLSDYKGRKVLLAAYGSW